MLVGSYPTTLLEALAVHSILEGLGYSTEDEIFMVFSDHSIIVRLEAEGISTDIRIGQPELSPKEMEQKWLELIAEWNTGGTMTRIDKDQLVKSSNVWARKRELIVTLVLAGFTRFTLLQKINLN